MQTTHTKQGLSGTSPHAAEVAGGERFEFGENWSRFLSTLDEGRVARAEETLRQILEVEDLEGRSFLDIGSGSGLFSLATRGSARAASR